MYRGPPNTDSTVSEIQNEYDGHSRAQRRAAGLPLLQQYTPTPLAYPLLSSFPFSIFTFDGDSHISEEITVKTRLTTDTEVGDWIKGLREVVVRGLGVGVEDREVLGNSLGEISEGFVGGWEGTSESEDDDD